MIQYIIIAIILAACVTYAAICIYRSIKQARECKNYQCSGCPFVKKCQKNKKERGYSTERTRVALIKELLKLLFTVMQRGNQTKNKAFQNPFIMSKIQRK